MKEFLKKSLIVNYFSLLVKYIWISFQWEIIKLTCERVKIKIWNKEVKSFKEMLIIISVSVILEARLKNISFGGERYTINFTLK